MMCLGTELLNCGWDLSCQLFRQMSTDPGFWTFGVIPRLSEAATGEEDINGSAKKLWSIYDGHDLMQEFGVGFVPW